MCFKQVSYGYRTVMEYKGKHISGIPKSATVVGGEGFFFDPEILFSLNIFSQTFQTRMIVFQTDRGRLELHSEYLYHGYWADRKFFTVV